jgi:hypothetical protein
MPSLLYHDLMTRRHQVFISIVAVLLALAMAGWRASVRDANGIVPKLANPMDNAINTLAPPPLPVRAWKVSGIEMTPYRSPYGYEITYPAAWHTLSLPDAYGDQRKTDAHYYFSPLPINEELHRLLLRPAECDYGDPGGCSEVFTKYAATDYALLDILAQQFDSGIVMPAIFIPEEYRGSAQPVELTGSKGVFWIDSTQDTRVLMVDNERQNVRYQVTIRDPKKYGLSFNDVLPIIYSFHLTE